MVNSDDRDQSDAVTSTTIDRLKTDKRDDLATPYVWMQSYSRILKKSVDEEKNISLAEVDSVKIITDEEPDCESKRIKLDVGGETNSILDNSAAKHKLSIRPKKKYADSRQKNVTSTTDSISYTKNICGDFYQETLDCRNIVKQLPDKGSDEYIDTLCKREAVVKELLETEDEFCRDLSFTVDRYIRPSEGNLAPAIVRNNTDVIFSNFKLIANFHNTILIEGIKYYSNEPRMLGKTFLRLERDFDKHISYCRDVPAAEEFLALNQQVMEFFEDLSQKSGDGKNILEYLKLPVQRINDYQVLLKDILKYSDKLGENTHDLNKALELMLAIPQRANDNKFLNNIEGFHGNIHKLGRLLRHDWFAIEFDGKEPKERYLFLFKDHIIISKVKKISEDRSVFSLKNLISISEVKIRDNLDDKSFEILLGDDEGDCNRIKVYARKNGVKDFWFEEIKKYVPSAFEKFEKKLEEENPKSIGVNCKKIKLENQDQSEEETKKSIQLKKVSGDSFAEKDLSGAATNESTNETSDQIIQENIEQFDKMNRRFSTNRSFKSREESYSVSASHEAYVHSSSSLSRKFSSTSVYDSKTSFSKNYENVTVTDTTARGIERQREISKAILGSEADKPIFTRTITGLHLEPGETAVFECQLDTEAKLTWLKDNKILEDKLADRVIQCSSDDGSHRLELQHVTEADSGTYTAWAQNDSSHATCTAQLVVEKISNEEVKRRENSNSPIFTVRLKDTELMKNTNFTFVVKVKGSPNPDVKFYKNNVAIKSGDDHIRINDEKAEIGFYELIISDVQANHAGTYSCIASNCYGEASCEGTLTVTDQKVVFKGIESDDLLTPGEKPTFTWFRNGKSFDPDERFKVLVGNEDDSLALIFQHVKPEDAGLYTCVASTTTGKISCSAELSVQGSVSPASRVPEKPSFSKETKIFEANVGGSALLEAKVLGYPNPDVKWYHEGKEIKAEGRYKFLFEDQETITLVIKNVNPRDCGSYKIIAKNELGEDCTELSLMVKGAPKIIKKMDDVEVNINEVIKINTLIEGSPAPDVKWFKNGKEIKESERIKMTKDLSDNNCYCLTIDSASAEDEGSYSVVASNEVNQCTDFCNVRVKRPPKIVKNMERDVQVFAGEDAVFQIEVSEKPAPNVKWMKDGVELKSDDKKIKITTDGASHTLRILNAEPEDSANYSVEISNEYGTTTDEGKATVTRKTCAPTFKTGLKDTIAREGETSVEFSVEVNAYPKPKIKWYLDEMEITEKRNEYAKLEDHDSNNYKLIVKKVTTELKGNYKCRIENDFGSAETSAKLIVQSKPVLARLLEPKVSVDEGAELTLQIECSGCPEPEVSWFKDGQEIQTDAHIKITKDSHRSESYSMTLTLIKSSDSGEYEAKATNCLGSATTKTYVQVLSSITETSEELAEGLMQKGKAEEPETNSLVSQEKEEEQIRRVTLELPKTKINLSEMSWGDLKVEEIDENNYEDEKNLHVTTGLVEECLDSENVSEHSHNRLHISRGVSIVSLSEDERTLSRNNSAVDASEKNDEIENEKELTAEEESPQKHEAKESDYWTSPKGAEIADTFEDVKEKKDEMFEAPPNESGPVGEPDFGQKNSLNDFPQQNDNDDAFFKPQAKYDSPGLETLRKSETANELDSESDVEEDPAVKALLKRIKKQRSVLEEILTKEADTQKEDKQQKPVFIRPLKNQTFSEKSSVIFECVLSGEPEPEITLMRDGKKVEIDGTKIKLEKRSKETEEKGTEHTYTFKIHESDATDAGLYVVKAQNKYGYDESSASLTILVEDDKQKPEIKQLKDVSTVLSEDAVFEAEVLSKTPVEVFWLDKNEEKIEGDDRIILTEDKVKGIYKLTIKKTKQEDIADYILVASNEAGSTRRRAKLFIHGELPSFVKPIDDTQVKHGEDVNFLVRCNGIPKPEVKWYKDGKEIVSTEGRVTVNTQTECQLSTCLDIQKFEVGDAGQYKVTATNPIGTAENKFELKILQTVPTFDKSLPRFLEVDDEVLQLKCKVTGSPKPEIKWLKDGEPLLPGENVKIIEESDGSAKLLVSDFTPEKSGTYTVVAENPNGKVVGQCAVSAQPRNSKPKFIEGIKDTAGVLGQPLLLEAKLKCHPRPEIKWFKNGRPLRPAQAVQKFNEEDGKLELLINSLKPEDAGDYSVKVINKLGESVQEAKVTVLEPQAKPKFLIPLSPVSAVEGSAVKFSVQVAGNPEPSVKWYHNGKEIVADNEFAAVKSQPDGNFILLLNKCTPENEGEYMAIAANDQGQVSCKAPLNVLSIKKADKENEEEPRFTGPLNDVTIDEGNDLVLDAPITGNPFPEVSWEKDGVPLQTSDRVLPVCNGKRVNLEIKSCKPTDSGVYTCRLSSRLGTDKSKGKVEVRKIFKEPTFEEKFLDVEQVAGRDAKFIARISGNPKPETEWFFNGEPITRADKYEIKCNQDKYWLIVKECTPQDGGLIRCSAFNRAGRAECVAQLSIVKKIETQQNVEPPSFLKKITDCDVYKGMTAKFTACCTGFPKPDFEWFKDGEKLKAGGRYKMDDEGNGLIRLTISSVVEEDVGTYCLKISNPHGEAECSGRLICDTFDRRPKRAVPDKKERKEKRLGGVPSPLSSKPIISRMTDRHLTLSWKPYIPSGPYPPVTYVVEMREQPDGEWFTARRGIRSCACDIRNLEPFKDYQFRVCVENKYGISDPSPYAETYRKKILPDLAKFKPYDKSGAGDHPDAFPKGFHLDRPPHDRHEQAPEFLRQEHDVQYGAKNQNCNLFWFVYGYPEPTMSYYFNDEPIEMGGRFECSYTRNGLATLFVNRMLDRDVGTYEAVAKNEHGEARQRVRLEISEHPVFIQRPEESYVMLQNNVTLTARVFGVPSPEIKWYKDWQPLANSSRIKIQETASGTHTLTISDAIFRDEGLYSISATNVAGTASSSAMIHVEENEEAYNYATYGTKLNIKAKREPFSNYYDIGDELGRGTQGIIYHAVDRRTGHNYAAKFMHGISELKPFMLNELNVMNSLNHRKLIRLHDSFETNDLVVIVMELAGGGELLDWLIKQSYTTETEIASYIRQILWGLEYMHSNGYAHLSLTLNDLLLSRLDGDDLKICDFSLSRKITHGNLLSLNYGMPEFIAPEVANGEGVNYSADLWSLGIITYILLSGVSPFKGLNDRETLTRIKEGKWEFDEDHFRGISLEARDFISKLLVYKGEERMDVKTALRHPWFERIDKTSLDQLRIETTNLRNYHSSLRNWYKNANCNPRYRRIPLNNAFVHPSKMVYPPGDYDFPENNITLGTNTRQFNGHSGTEETITLREPLDYEIGNFKSESQYQNGPDTYLLQLRDVELPCRLRHYMKVAADRQHSFSSELPERHIDWRTPVIRERRKFMDVMDEEIDDERRARINQYGSDDVYSLRRLKHEIGCRSDSHAEAKAMLEYKSDGRPPFFREKPHNLAVIQNKPAEFCCLVAGDPFPTVQWFKNDLVLAETSRIKMVNDQNNRFYLKFEPALSTDVGTYKIVARNKIGQAIARAKIVVATIPLPPNPPEIMNVSDTEILLGWMQECDDPFAPILCFSLQYKLSDDENWIDVEKNIKHKFWLVKNLEPETSYDFRLCSKNDVGWSAPGLPLISAKTKGLGSPKIMVSKVQIQIQSQTEMKAENELKEQEKKSQLDYKIEDSPIEWDANINFDSQYEIKSEIARGQYSMIVKGLDKSTGLPIVAKIFDVNSDTEKSVAREFDCIKYLRHDRIVTLLSALRPAPNVAIFLMEKLQGADILSYFASRKEYNEDMVTNVLVQVLDGLQYLHWKGICHLNIQPDNIVLSCANSLQIKLVDFGSAQKVSKLGTIVTVPFTDYSAPEILSNEPAFPQSDVWSLGVVAYVLLSGVSPFKGDTDEETQKNIVFVRYRFEHLYKELTQEATRFIMQIFKRTPSKRPTVDECYETRWLLSSDFIIKKRQKACFPGSRLKEYNEAYHKEKFEKSLTLNSFSKIIGEKALKKSNSVEEELSTF